MAWPLKYVNHFWSRGHLYKQSEFCVIVEDKVLPKDSDSDYSLPGRYEESNFTYEQPIALREYTKIKE